MIVKTKIICEIIIIFIITTLIPISLSNGDEIEATMTFNVEGNGFHRTINYQVNIENCYKNNCYIALNVDIPCTLFVNNDELADSGRLGNITACSIGETDVELFAEDAKSQQLTVCTNLNNNYSNILSFKLHQRYQHARNNENYIDIILPNPKLLLGCKERIKGYLISKLDICQSCAKLIYKWREIPYKMKNESYTWIIPVGQSSQRSYVTWITLIVPVVATFFIIKLLWQQN